MRHACQRVAPCFAHLVRNIFVATGKRYRLECDCLNLIDVLGGKLNNLTNAVVVDIVDDGDNQGHLNANTCEVLNRAQFYVEQVANAAMFILLFAHAVKLQIAPVLSGCFGCFAKLNVFCEANSVGGRENSVKTDLLCVLNCLQVIRRKSWLATGEENDYLSLGFEG